MLGPIRRKFSFYFYLCTVKLNCLETSCTFVYSSTSIFNLPYPLTSAPGLRCLIFKLLPLTDSRKISAPKSLAICLQPTVSTNKCQSTWFCLTKEYYAGLRRIVPIWNVAEMRKARQELLQRLSTTELAGLVAAWFRTARWSRREGWLVL